jgi:hypothetical protein
VFSRHCSDAQLLAHLDGELSAWERVRVQSHLEKCWACRGRREALEKQAHLFALPFEGGIFGADWAKKARKRFLERRNHYETTCRPRSARPANDRVLPFALALAAAIACIAVVEYEYARRKPAGPTTSQVIAHVRRAEADLERNSVHQVFRVEAGEIHPKPARRTGRIEVWSDRQNGRYASRWAEDGEIRYATWRNSASREFVGNGAPPAQGHSLVRLDASSADASAVENHFLRWLEARRWRPISFGEDVAAFLSEDGVVVRAERSVSADGRKILRLVARRRQASLAAELVFEVDEATHWPRLYRLRLDSAERSVEFVLAAEKAESVSPGGFDAAVFEPEVRQRASVPRTPRPDLGGAGTPGSVAPAGLAALEVQAHYALHRARACMGEPVEVVTGQGGRVAIRGLVQDAARREEILESARRLAFVDVEVRTYEEAVREDVSRPPLEPLLIAPDIRVGGTRVLADEAMRRRLSDRSGDADRVAADYANQAVSDSARLLANAWALRRLADAFPSERTNALPLPVAWLLEAMVQDHAEEGAELLAASRARLEPVLRELTGAELTAGLPAEDSDWRSACKSLQAGAAKVEQLTRSLFTVSGAGAEPPNELAAALWRQLSSASNSLALMKAAVEPNRQHASEKRLAGPVPE